MTILALETSTPRASVAVWRDGAVVREWTFQSERSHNSLLFGPLGQALDTATPDLIAVGTGPGSYAGVRVALAAGLAISLAAEIPLVGWPSLTACDLPGDSGLIVGDARRGGFFLAEVTDGRLAGPPVIVEAGELAARTGGATVRTFDDRLPVAQAMRVIPSAGWLARRVAELTPSERAALAAATPEPVYLRAPFVTTPKPRAAGWSPEGAGPSLPAGGGRGGIDFG